MKSLIIALVVSALAAPYSAASPNETPPSSLKLNFNIKRGSSRDSLSPIGDSKPRFVKRDDNDEGSAEIELINEQTFYYANLYIGSNEDVNQVLVDTGSSDLWVMSHDLECYASNYGKKKREAKNVFHHIGSGPKFIEDIEDNGELSKATKTSKSNKDAKNQAKEETDYNSYATDYSELSGYPDLSDYPEPTYNPYSEYPEPSYNPYSDYSYESYYGGYATCTYYGSFNTENSDSFVRNDTEAFDISYADGTFASGIWGHDTVKIGNLSVKDLSFAVANQSSSDVGVLGIGLPGLEVTNDRGGYMYENLPLKMKSDGVIKKALYSLYLSDVDDETGSILFGAVDHAKYVQTLETLKLRNTYKEYDFPVKFDVPVDKIVVTNKDGKATTVLSSTEGVVLDSGSTLSYVRSDQLDTIGDALDGVFSGDAMTYEVDCDYLHDSAAVLNITFGSKTITVPIPDLILEATYGSTCYLGLFAQSSSSPYILFGDNILRHAYIVYDLEDNEVHIGQAYYTDDEDIEVVEGSVPTTGGQDPTSTTYEPATETEESTEDRSDSETENDSTTASRSTTRSTTRMVPGFTSSDTGTSVTSSKLELTSETGSETDSSSSAADTASSTQSGGDSNEGLVVHSNLRGYSLAGWLFIFALVI